MPQLAFPFGLIGGSAGLACACVSGFVSTDEGWVASVDRGHVVGLVGLAAGAVVGAVVTQLIRRELPAHWIAKLVALVSLSAAFAGVLVIATSDAPADWGLPAFVTGGLVGLAISPALAWSVWYARRAVRSRSRSIAGRTDRRSALRIAAVVSAAAAVALPFTVGPSGFFAKQALTHSDARSGAWPILLLSVGAVVALFVLVRDSIAHGRARRAARTLATAPHLEHQACGAECAVEATPGVIDLGIGEDTWLHVEDALEYRSVPVRRAEVLGDVDASLSVTRRAFVASSTAFVLVFLIAVAVLPGAVR